MSDERRPLACRHAAQQQSRWAALVMAQSLEELEACVSRLDAAIKPIAERPVDLSRPGAFDDLAAGPHPLDESATREETEELLLELITDYTEASSEWRAGVRSLFSRFRSFAWAAGAPLDIGTIDGLRAHLILFSLKDQGQDPRDAKLWLDELLDRAREAGLETSPLLRRVAALSSDEDRYGWGSTRRWLNDASNKHP